MTNSPETETHAGRTMPLADICAAAITLSDNTAGNLMLGTIGGPEGLTAFLRSLGDDVTRLDRTELALNEAVPGDPRDTTSPSAMVADLHTLLLGEALSATSRGVLTGWLIANTTGDARLRAGLPDDWRAGDKTGTCNSVTANDVAIVWPPERKPILIAAYLAEAEADRDAQNAALADVGRAVAAALG